MQQQVSRDHHTVPKLYLRGFADKRGELRSRHRDGHEDVLTIKQATVEVDFYDVGEANLLDDTLERWFGREIESAVGDVMHNLRKGALPAPGPETEALAAFVAIQMVRTITFRRQLQQMSSRIGPLIFANMVLDRALQRDPSLRASRDLARWHASIAEVAPSETKQSDTKSIMRNMVRAADTLKSQLQAMSFLLSTSADPKLVTGDSPVVAFDDQSDLPFTPIPLPDTYEIYLPVTPKVLLTVTPLPILGSSNGLSREHADLVNKAIGRTCSDVVLRSPGMDWPADLILLPEPTPLRSPLVTVTRGGGAPASQRSWPTVIHSEFEKALKILGGDPVLADHASPEAEPGGQTVRQ
ncbi:DUF4238 domain-containing protein [Allorhizocola rhizosphaerae]|uniref:DUF4238 domain-containing protein n=1 Tax=Allorhizocola rhizosphaerae TaxID=1872709 RepID=UPI0013C36FB8|nr:DUF4238 domain-containing protein [Allorhizocola rhizosphaerae]